MTNPGPDPALSASSSGPSSGPAAARSGVVTVAIRGIGWLLIGAGAFLLLFLVWLLWFTGLSTHAAQDELLGAFEGFGAVNVDGDLLEGAGTDDPTLGGADTGDPDIGSGYAVLEFERPDVGPVVLDDPVVVVEGTTVGALQRGPGHYKNTARPGQVGNFAIAGHRTTYGAPFYNLDKIQPGDLIHVTDRAGDRFTYEVMEGSGGGGMPGQHIVRPTETWVLDNDPRGTGGAVLTLSTCHPRFSATYRLIVFAELVS